MTYNERGTPVRGKRSWATSEKRCELSFGGHGRKLAEGRDKEPDSKEYLGGKTGEKPKKEQ